MRIAFYCNDGSPIGIIPPDLYGRGLGGAEYALVSLTEELAKFGHEVIVYNDPKLPGLYDGVEYRLRRDYEDNNDVLVLFRSPNNVIKSSKAPLKLFWSCDQRTTGNYVSQIFPFVDGVICISPRHVDYFRTAYGITDRITCLDLGVRLDDYRRVEAEGVQKRARQAIFCSVPDRGLHRLRAIWPRIKEAVPDLNLIITSDYRLWGAPDPRNYQHIQMWAMEQDVSFKGAVSRNELVRLQLESDVHIYPCIYDELFCISVAETQCAGAVPITSAAGAIRTTNEWGWCLEGVYTSEEWLSDFADFVILALTERYDQLIAGIRNEMVAEARKRFSWERIATDWETIFRVGV